LVIIAIVAAALVPVAAVAADAPAPQELDLPDAPVLISVDRADVTVTVDPDAAPLLRWVAAEPDGPGLAELAPSSVDGRVVVERPPVPDGAAVARIAIGVVLRSSLGLSVAGDDVELTVQHAGSPSQQSDEADQEAAEKAQATGARPLELGLTRSRIQVTGASGLVGSVADCLTFTGGTTGNLELTATGGDLRIADHEGRLKLIGQGASLVAERARGPILIQSTGGSVLLDGAHGSFNITGTDARVELVRTQGNGTLTGATATLDVRDSRINRLNLRGEASYVTLSQTTATVTIDLSGGSLTADDASGMLNGSAREGTGVAVTAFAGDVSLNLSSGARADLRDIDGHVSATVTGAELGVDGARSLSLRADDGWTSAAAIAELKKFNAQRSRVELDLTGADATDFSIRVGEESSLRLDVATPCRVRVTGVDATLASQVEVLGCELQFGQGRRWATRRVRGVDGNLPTTLTVTMADSAELLVEGR
jgi:hypothetical protein